MYCCIFLSSGHAAYGDALLFGDKSDKYPIQGEYALYICMFCGNSCVRIHYFTPKPCRQIGEFLRGKRKVEPKH